MTDNGLRSKSLRRGVYILPSLFTVGNIFCGFFSVIATLRGELRTAAILILVAVIADVFDGRVARLTGATSSFGEAYDNLADVVSFGMAPAVLAVQWGLWQRPRLGLAVAFLFLVAGSIRLARFQSHDMSHYAFEGLPIPAGASAVALVTLLSPRPVQGQEFPWIVAAFLLCLALLMVSKLPYRAFKDVDLKNRWPVTTLFAIAAVFSATVFAPAKVLALLLGIYILSAPVMLVVGLVPRRKPDPPGTAEQSAYPEENPDVESAAPDLSS